MTIVTIPDTESAGAYRSGFVRCLRLLNLIQGESPLYSEEFARTLRYYFEVSGYAHHPRIAEWWADHVGKRVGHALNVFLPWAERHVPLAGRTVLEVGCGTGSSTVALASRAEHVYAVDLDRPSIAVAERRLVEEGLRERVTFSAVDSSLQGFEIPSGGVDVAVFYAALEHMLPAERQLWIDLVWQYVVPGGFVIVYETPNRLYPYDAHTTGLWGWSWLPPRVALWYGKARGRFRPTQSVEEMYREGYGLHFWEVKRLLGNKQYQFLSRTPPEKLSKRLLVAPRQALGLPRWALPRMLNFVIRKVA
jgi:SAM-dependent methyltransferase